MKSEDLLAAAAGQPEHSPERALLVTAAIELALGKPVVLVGGAAVNTYTGEYRPTDLDLIGDVNRQDRALLTRLGFSDPGRGHRHLSIILRQGEAPLLVEFPPPPLLTRAVDLVEVAPGVAARVISLVDLVLDRLRQATDATPVTREAAVALAVATYAEIDWEEIHSRVTSERLDLPALPSTLNVIRREARRALRPRSV